MPNKKTNQDQLYIRPSYDFRQILAEILKLTDDKRIKNQEWGWWSRLAYKALTVYRDHLKAGKESQ